MLTAFGAGIDQAENSFPEYGQGVQGYAKRYGAAYTDYFTGNLLGNAVLAGLLKEDPRYFQKGTGSFSSRALWAARGTVWCKRDSGTWGPNYANVVGNLIGGAISNFYYPASDRTVGGTLGRVLRLQRRRLSAVKSSNSGPTWCATTGESKRKSWPSRWGKAGGKTARGLLLNPSRIPPPQTLKTLSWRYFHHVSPAGPHILTSLGTEVLG